MLDLKQSINRLKKKKWGGGKRSNTVHFSIHVFQAGHGYFLGACVECPFRAGDSSCLRLRQSLAGRKKGTQKTLQRFSSKYKAFSFIDESRQRESYAFCKICRCDFNISHGGRNDITAHCGTFPLKIVSYKCRRSACAFRGLQTSAPSKPRLLLSASVQDVARLVLRRFNMLQLQGAVPPDPCLPWTPPPPPNPPPITILLFTSLGLAAMYLS